jgi:hypothetical protein
MGTGIGINCRRCGEQLNHDDGFDDQLQLCHRCASIVKFDQLSKSETCRDPDDYYPTPYGISSFDTKVLIDELRSRIEWNMKEREKDEILNMARFILQLRYPDAPFAYIRLTNEKSNLIKLPER